MTTKSRKETPGEGRKDTFRTFWEDTKKRFSLSEGSAPQQEVVDGITEGIYFRGANMWILMFATMVASLGLNVNSTAVIIGAMLISPLMGPIMGFGLSLGINDFWLMNRSLRNFGFMVATAIVTATLFFLVVPISGAQSELLARTQPTIFDVLIAFFGGAAGVVAYTRKDRTVTVISGVAIATALMPPLCTAGYGIATTQWRFFGGALYLFVINAIFIALSTYAIVRVLKYNPKVQVGRRMAKRVKRLMWTIITITVLPSIYIAFRLIDQGVFESNVERFVNAEFRFEDTGVLEKASTYSMYRKKNPCTVTLMLYGERLHESTIENIRGKMPQYDLDGVALTIKQAGEAAQVDLAPLQQGYSQVLEEKNRQIAELRRLLSAAPAGNEGELRETVEEFRAIMPAEVEGFSISKHPVWVGRAADAAGSEGSAAGGAERGGKALAGGVEMAADTVLVCILKSGRELSYEDLERVERWLGVKYKTDKVKIYVE